MKILVMGGWAPSLIAFRGQLLERLRSLGHEVVACAADGDERTTAALEAIGVRYVELPLARAGTNPLRDSQTFAAVLRLVRRERPDLFLGYTIKPVIYGCLAARLGGVPRVFAMITGLGYAFIDQSTPRRRLLAHLVRGLYRASLAGTTGVLFQNPDDHAEFARHHMLLARTPVTIVNGSGVDTAHYAPSPVPEGPPVFLFVGRLLAEKGIHELVAAARKVRQEAPEVRVQVLGGLDPNPASLSAEAVERLGREGVIEYLGTTEDVRPYLAEATAIVLPSYREGTPRSVLEALAVGRAAIVTDVPGCRETVMDGHNGFLVPPRDADALAHAMLRLAREPGRAVTMGEASRELACTKYDVHRVNREVCAALGLEDAA